MKFLVVALVVIATVAADHHTMGDRGDLMKRIAMPVLMMDVKDMHSCTTDADCASVADKPKCCPQFKLCKPATSPELDMEYGTCQGDGDCRPTYRCKNSKCQFAGPKACTTDGDCLQGITGHVYECKENPLTAPGQRCWLKCTTDRDCYSCTGDTCLMPVPIQEKLGCCQGNCQKKAACM